MYGLTDECSIRQRFHRHYLPDEPPREVKLDQDDVTQICQRVVDHDVETVLVAEQFEISRRRVQHLAKEYRDDGEIPQLETPGRKPYAEYPDNLEDRILDLRQRPHMSLDWENLETPSEAFDRLLPSPQEDLDDQFATEVSTDE